MAVFFVLGTWIHVHEEFTEKFTGCTIHDAEVLDVLVPQRRVGRRLHRDVLDAVQSLGYLEESITHLLEREVLADDVRIDVVVTFPDSLHVVAEIPWIQLRIGIPNIGIFASRRSA